MHNILHYMGKGDLWLVTQSEEGRQKRVLVQGTCNLELSAMEACEQGAGTNTCAAVVACGSFHTMGPF